MRSFRIRPRRRIELFSAWGFLGFAILTIIFAAWTRAGLLMAAGIGFAVVSVAYFLRAGSKGYVVTEAGLRGQDRWGRGFEATWDDVKRITCRLNATGAPLVFELDGGLNPLAGAIEGGHDHELWSFLLDHPPARPKLDPGFAEHMAAELAPFLDLPEPPPPSPGDPGPVAFTPDLATLLVGGLFFLALGLGMLALGAIVDDDWGMWVFAGVISAPFLAGGVFVLVAARIGGFVADRDGIRGRNDRLRSFDVTWADVDRVGLQRGMSRSVANIEFRLTVDGRPRKLTNYAMDVDTTRLAELLFHHPPARARLAPEIERLLRAELTPE
jgi:hypothetical protein